jgi:protein phosphatase
VSGGGEDPGGALAPERVPRVVVPRRSLVLLVGASGSGKSTFAARHFLPSEVLSSDAFRALVSDDERDMSATADAFEVLHLVAARRLANGRLTVVDATNVEPASRRPLLALAREHGSAPLAIVLDLPVALCVERNAARGDRRVPPWVVRRQQGLLRRSLGGLEREGLRRVLVLRTPAEVDAARVERERAPGDQREDHHP